ncbi:MAG: hypothetical protein M5U26_29965 [Planctomycetota bacterium]|nr:hypothetical protein [Planctomycetota bacterium]
MKPAFWDYVKSAFSARPLGMFLPPNWVGLAACGLLGLVNPGFWVLGAGLEIGYLYTLVSNKRFRRVVDAEFLARARKVWEAKQEKLMDRLDADDRSLYRRLERRCQTILQQAYGGAGPSETTLQTQGEGLGRLLWIYLRLLLTRGQIRQGILGDDEDGEGLQARIVELEEKLKDDGLSENLRKSYASQKEILQARVAKRAEAQEKLSFLDAELTRVEEQAELIREQALLSADPDTVSSRIDEVAARLDGTAQWIQQQQKMYGQVEDLLVDAPPVSVAPLEKEAS